MKMDFINRYKVVFAVVLPVLILVLIRSFGTNHFKTDATKWAEPSLSKSNIVSIGQLAGISGEKLVINLGTVNEELNKQGITILNISPASILDENNIKLIKKHKGSVLLFSTEVGVSSKIWMILSQMGLKNIFILATDSDIEVQKFKFIQDSILKPAF
jgi:hypothetical protein